MKRDWDLIRAILIQAENAGTGQLLTPEQITGGWDINSVVYQIRLLLDAGLIEGDVKDCCGGGPSWAMIKRLTWNGHEFLDQIRSNQVWERVKATALEKGIDLTIDLTAKLAARFTKDLLGLA